MQPLKDWPQMRPFNGNMYLHASLEASSYQNAGWWQTAIGWDTAAIRAGALTDSKEPAEASATTEIPEITSTAWEDVSTKALRKDTDMPYTTSLTTLKVLHDQNNLYVRIDIRGATKAFEDMLPPKSENDVFKQEHVDLSIQPKAGGATYRFAANPVEGLHYDAVMNAEEDTSWNGKWKFAYQINPATTAEDQPYLSWTAWFQIPFSDLGAAAPTAGETWKLDVSRKGIYESTKPLWQSWHGEVRVEP